MLGFICGILMIKWFPLTFPIEASELFVSFVFHPLEFFAACLMFIIGIIVNGKIIKSMITILVTAVNKRNIPFQKFALGIVLLVVYAALLKEGFWQTLALLSFSIAYGIISLDFRKEKTL